MSAKIWEFDRAIWPPIFGRKWLWTIFAEPSHHKRVVDICIKTGMTDLVVLVNDSPADQPDFSVRGRIKDYVALSALARKNGLTFHVATWIDPKKAYVEAAAAGMAELARLTKAKTTILDLEGEYRKRIKNHRAFVASTLAPAFVAHPTPIGVTSFAMLPREVVSALAWAVEYHDGFGMPQAYPIYSGKKYQRVNINQPDQLSSVAWRTWSPITRRLVCILAAFGTPPPGREIVDGEWSGEPWGVKEAAEVSAQRAQLDGFEEVSWWSEEALAGYDADDRVRISVLAQVGATGRSMYRAAWGKIAKITGAIAAATGGLFIATRWRK